jgi:hypothetical protein
VSEEGVCVGRKCVGRGSVRRKGSVGRTKRESEKRKVIKSGKAELRFFSVETYFYYYYYRFRLTNEYSELRMRKKNCVTSSL